MPDELLPNLFRLKIPLPRTPFKYLNAYVIKGEGKNLVVDTGLKQPECRIAMLNGLKSLDIDIASIDFFITHFHADHIGLIGDLVTKDCKVYLSQQDMENIERLQSFEPIIRPAIKNGYPEDKIRSLFARRPGIDYGSNWLPNVQFIDDNDVLEIGTYRFHCILTPGHSMGHICLYDKEKQLLISGDHVLDDISSNISCWFDTIDPLKDYLESLDRLSMLDVAYVLPGHRGTFNNLKKRIKELKDHHYLQLRKIKDILKKRIKELKDHHYLQLRKIKDILKKSFTQLSAFEIAERMLGDVKGYPRDNYPKLLQYFTTGEVVANLRYLENRKLVRRYQENPVITYGTFNE